MTLTDQFPDFQHHRAFVYSTSGKDELPQFLSVFWLIWKVQRTFDGQVSSISILLKIGLKLYTFRIMETCIWLLMPWLT